MARDGLVAVYDPKARERLRELIKDGEQHWVGGIVDYSGGLNMREPNEDKID